MRAAILALSVLVSGVVAAKPAKDPASVEMRTAYEDGMAAYNLGHFDEALEAFERGYRVKRDPAFLFNIAQCQRSLHKPEDAARSYRTFLRESPQVQGDWNAERKQYEGLFEMSVGSYVYYRIYRK